MRHRDCCLTRACNGCRSLRDAAPLMRKVVQRTEEVASSAIIWAEAADETDVRT